MLVIPWGVLNKGEVEMLLVVDIGNTNIVLGIYREKELLCHWRISTDRQRTSDEYGMLIYN